MSLLVDKAVDHGPAPFARVWEEIPPPKSPSDLERIRKRIDWAVSELEDVNVTLQGSRKAPPPRDDIQRLVVSLVMWSEPVRRRMEATEVWPQALAIPDAAENTFQAHWMLLELRQCFMEWFLNDLSEKERGARRSDA